MAQMTLTLDDEIAHWVRLRAAEEGVTVSGFVESLLGDRMRPDRYEQARRSYLGRRPSSLSAGAPYPSREEIHQRSNTDFP